MHWVFKYVLIKTLILINYLVLWILVSADTEIILISEVKHV